MKTPINLKYAKTDEWVKIDGDEAIIGITDYAQDQLSDVVYVEFLIDEGDKVEKDEEFATIESVKAAASINALVSGTIVEVNPKVVDEPEIINADPYEDGWLVKIKLTDPSEVDDLLSAEEYEAYNEERED